MGGGAPFGMAGMMAGGMPSGGPGGGGGPVDPNQMANYFRMMRCVALSLSLARASSYQQPPLPPPSLRPADVPTFFDLLARFGSAGMGAGMPGMGMGRPGQSPMMK